MKIKFVHPKVRSRGSALLIVLALLLLLTTLTVAFLSRATLERQLSNASFSQGKVDLAGQGAIAQVIGDLQQEIIAGSNGTGTPTLATGYYYPSSPTTVIPAVVGFTPAAGVENLLKISQRGTSFWPSSGYTTAGPARAASVSTVANSSLNNRSISNARWNKPLLMNPINVSSSNTTDFTPPSAFTSNPPDWIYVARDGSNPTGTMLDSSYIYSPNVSPTATPTLGTFGTNPVTQRYAYAIYDEGSTLDVNVAGSPFTSTSAPYYSANQPYKNALAYADLTQLPIISSLSASNQQSFINALVGWRNFASDYNSSATPTAVSGTFPGPYTFPGLISGSTLTPFDLNVVQNAGGFISVAGNSPQSGPNVAGSQNQTDNGFTSRQQLLQFVLQGLGQNTSFISSVPLAKMEQTLQYLGTFSRDLSQPSYAPSPAKVAAAPTAAIASGGNDQAGGGTDAVINPALLAAAVTTSYTRNNGNTAVIGEPLVKKRFALSRLAWLTCDGPIATDAGVLNTADPIISKIVSILENSYGYSASFLAQGGPTNIYKYFGLQWVTDNRTTVGDGQSKWYYNHEVIAFPNLSSITSPTAAHIRTLNAPASGVASLGRDADFFELLKAATCLGSLGKAYGTSAASVANFNINNPDPLAWQAQLDNSVDGSLIQMGANIIDQFQPCGYCARILFADGTVGYPLEFRGVEDMPYFYRVRQGEIMTADSTPSQTTFPSTGTTSLSSATQGSGVVMYQPEIWNPHAWNKSNPDSNPRPTIFRVVAISAPPSQISSADTSTSATAINIEPGWRWINGSYSSSGTADGSAVSTTLTGANTAMTFNIPTGDLYLFREPTLLIKPGIPTGSSLASVSATVSASNGTTAITAAQYSKAGVTDNSKYIGIMIGTLPMAWIGTIPVGGVDGTNPTTATTGAIPTGVVDYAGGPYGITYRMEYQNASGNWVVYDEKYSIPFQSESWNIPAGGYLGANKTFGVESAGSTVADCIIGAYGSYVAIDPRSSRFGLAYSGTNGRGLTAYQFPLGCTVNLPGQAGTVYYSGWAAPVGSAANSTAMSTAAQQSAIWTTRPDEYRGLNFSSYDNQGLAFGYNTGPTGGTTPQGNGTLLSAYGGWYPLPTTASTTGTGYGSSAVIEPGLLVQNNPQVTSATSALRFTGESDNQTPTAGFNQFFADADGVVRRAMAAYVPTGSSSPAIADTTAGQPSGLPTKEAVDYTQNPPAPNTTTNEYQSRPIMLNRPFHSVADLSYVFSGTPWRNLDMSTPESSAAPLLDVFCVNDTNDPNNLVAGKANLNTRQKTVLNAILAGAYTDEFNPNATSGNSATLSSTYASAISTALVNRTTSTAGNGLGPLANVSELVGKWYNSSTSNTSPSLNGGSSYIGFTSDLVNNPQANANGMYDLTAGLFQAATNAGTTTDNVNSRVERFRDATVRALANTTTTRVWNLMIDVITQTGRFPSSASNLANFNVEGERRYWVHVAIDRYTGKVLDEQIEEVKE